MVDDASAPRGLGGLTNEYAAMPSLHVAWALWCGWQVAAYARHKWVRVVGVLYPVSTVIAVMGTGNHFFLDVVGGVVVLLLAAVLVAFGERLTGRLRHPPPGQASASPAIHSDQERFQSA